MLNFRKIGKSKAELLQFNHF